MAVYVRGAGAHIAERVQPEPGSDEDKRLAALADEPVSAGRRLDEPKRPPRRGKKGSTPGGDEGE